MTDEEFERARRANERAGQVLVALLVAWGAAYLWLLRPAVNAFTSAHAGVTLGVLHLVPILAPVAWLGFRLRKKYPAPVRPE